MAEKLKRLLAERNKRIQELEAEIAALKAKAEKPAKAAASKPKTKRVATTTRRRKKDAD